MSKKLFDLAVKSARLSSASQTWFPRWVSRYASYLQSPDDAALPVDRERVIAFLQMLRDRTVPAWQRLQAVEAIIAYQTLVRKDAEPTLTDVLLKLTELAQRERNSGLPNSQSGEIGIIDPQEPEVIQSTRTALRRMHYAMRTERSYVGWIQRFLAGHKGRTIAELGENEIKEFLGELATAGQVSASTQNQALSALLFLFQKVLGRQLEFLDYVRAKRPEHLPVVLSQEEVRRLALHFEGTKLLLFQLLYGAGLRHLEGLRLRVKDIEFDRRQIVVRDGKGEKDRTTILPEISQAALRTQIARVKEAHARDLAEGFGSVELPYALARKYPRADRETAWQFLFPAPQLSRDPRSGVRRRHHLHQSVFEKAMKAAVRRAGIEKHVTPHTLRHSFATPTHLRCVPARRRQGHSHDPRIAGPRRREHDDDLHARQHGRRDGCAESVGSAGADLSAQP
jgi:integron integrase